MAKIHTLKKSGKTIYPATTTDAVIEPGLRQTVTKLLNEINLSKVYGGTYSLVEAIAKMGAVCPEGSRYECMKMTFLSSESGEAETYAWLGGTFANVNRWLRIGGGDSIVLAWKGTARDTRLQVNANRRKPGLIVSYKHPEAGWVNEQFTGETAAVEAWQKDGNWMRLASQAYVMSEINKLSGQLDDLRMELAALRYNAVVFSPSTVPTMAVMRWADILAYNEDTTPEVAARYLEPLWEGLLEACMGSTTAAVYAEGNNSYAPQEGILVPATRTERIRMVPVSASSNRTALGDTATLNLRYAHLAKVWNLTIVRTAGKGDAVTYRVTRQEVPTGSGSGQPVEPGDDVMQRLTRLEASLTL